MKKSFFIKGLVASAGFMMLSACHSGNSDDAGTAISADYTASYDETTNTSQYTARFQDDDNNSTVELSGGMSVQIDGLELSEDQTNSGDIQYGASVAAGYSQTHEFDFLDENGDDVTNIFAFPSLVEAVNGQNGYASLSNGYSVAWNASGVVGLGDVIVTYLDDANGREISTSDTSGFTNGTAFFTPAQLSQLTTSQLTLQFCHETTNTDAQAETGGSLEISSCSRVLPVTLGQ